MILDLLMRRCFDPGALLAVQSAGAITQMAGGIGQMGAAGQEASLQKQQGEIALQESQTNANLETTQQTIDVQNQRLAFLANGVSLEGSPSMVVNASKSYAQTQVQSILNQGAAQYNLAQRQAAQTQNQGRAALIAGIAGGVGELSKGAEAFTKSTGKAPGLKNFFGF